MADLSKVRGLKQVFGNMRKLQAKHAAGFERATKINTQFLSAQSAKEVPVDEGNLKASRFARTSGSGFATKGAVGYTAAYALYVHEDLDAAHGAAFNQKHADEIEAGTEHSRGEGQKAKYLEDPAKSKANKAIMLATCVREMKR